MKTVFTTLHPPMLRVHSLETFGTHEWPGIRFVLFLQGCLFRCLYCENPDTIEQAWGTMMQADEIVEKVLRTKEYFGTTPMSQSPSVKEHHIGWVTVSGGEPLLQAEWLKEFFTKLKEKGVHIAVDTNGFPLNSHVKELIDNDLIDLYIVDVKQINDAKHKKLTTQSNVPVLQFIDYLEEHGKQMWLRYVLVPWYTDDPTELEEIGKRFWHYKYVERMEILPYHRLWVNKREELGWKYELNDVLPPWSEEIKKAADIFKQHFKEVYVR